MIQLNFVLALSTYLYIVFYSVFDVNCIICLFTRRPCEHTVKELLLGR